MNREQFFAKLAPLGEAELRSALWTLYWRGTATMRERVEGVVDPAEAKRAAAVAAQPPDATTVLGDVRYFTSLVSEGAYLVGDRRVSPKERSNWRFTFRRLVTAGLDALRGDEVDTAGQALALMVDLACELQTYDNLHSDDPVEAARFVVSDAIDQLWTRLRQVHSPTDFLRTATAQLVRWERTYGWTRHGEGWVAERETPLADKLARHLTTPDLWHTAADLYVEALDNHPADRPESWRPSNWAARERSASLRIWNGLLLDHLIGPDDAVLLDLIINHPALEGADNTYLQAVLALRQGDSDQARTLIRACLTDFPGRDDFLAFGARLGVEPPPRPTRTMVTM
jgi:hypothetical protein